MINKIFKIEGIENVKLLVNCHLDTLTIVLQEKTKSRWFDVINKVIVIDINTFDFEQIVINIIKDYFNKKEIERTVGNVLGDENSTIIEINDPEIEIIKQQLQGNTED